MNNEVNSTLSFAVRGLAEITSGTAALTAMRQAAEGSAAALRNQAWAASFFLRSATQMAGVLRGVVAEFAAVDDIIQRAKATLSDTRGEVQDLVDRVKLFRGTEHGPKAVATAILELYKAGSDAVTIGVDLKTTMNLMTESGLKLEEATIAVMTATQAWAGSTLRSDEVLNQLVVSADRSSLSLKGLLHQMTYAQGSAKAFNMSLAQTSALVEMVAPISGTQKAGTAVRAGISSLMGKQKMLGKLGIKSVDANGDPRNAERLLPEIVMALEGRKDKVDLVHKFFTARGKDVYTAMRTRMITGFTDEQGNYTRGAGVYSAMVKDVENPSKTLQGKADIIRQSLPQQFEQMKVRFSHAAMAFAEQMAGPMKILLGFFSTLAGALEKLMKIPILGDIIGLLAVIGPLVGAFKLLALTMSPLKTFLSGIGGTVRAAYDRGSMPHRFPTVFGGNPNSPMENLRAGRPVNPNSWYPPGVTKDPAANQVLGGYGANERAAGGGRSRRQATASSVGSAGAAAGAGQVINLSNNGGVWGMPGSQKQLGPAWSAYNTYGARDFSSTSPTGRPTHSGWNPTDEARRAYRHEPYLLGPGVTGRSRHPGRITGGGDFIMKASEPLSGIYSPTPLPYTPGGALVKWTGGGASSPFSVQQSAASAAAARDAAARNAPWAYNSPTYWAGRAYTPGERDAANAMASSRQSSATSYTMRKHSNEGLYPKGGPPGPAATPQINTVMASASTAIAPVASAGSRLAGVFGGLASTVGGLVGGMGLMAGVTWGLSEILDWWRKREEARAQKIKDQEEVASGFDAVGKGMAQMLSSGKMEVTPDIGKAIAHQPLLGDMMITGLARYKQLAAENEKTGANLPGGAILGKVLTEMAVSGGDRATKLLGAEGAAGVHDILRKRIPDAMRAGEGMTAIGSTKQVPDFVAAPDGAKKMFENDLTKQNTWSSLGFAESAQSSFSSLMGDMKSVLSDFSKKPIVINMHAGDGKTNVEGATWSTAQDNEIHVFLPEWK